MTLSGSEGLVDHLFRLGVNSMYHEAVYLGVQPFFEDFWFYKTIFALDTSFCNQNVRSPEWDNNVMSQHESKFS